ncbi:MAG: Glutathione amide reductase [Proteobacteria bacterium]|nr:MAG: Glutathione amide reductase [Pseudomonadota bacterium]
MTHYDLFVIGAGSGGLAAAKNAAKYGKKVAIAESERVGGTCVLRGCVPKKIMTYAAGYADAFKEAKGYGFKNSYEFNFAEFAQKRNAEIDRLNGIHISLLEKSGVELIMGKAKFNSENSVEVNGKTYTADKFIIAVGGTPTVPSTQGAEHMITSDEVWNLTKLPQKMVIWGGGYIAVEFASIFQSLGTEVSIIIRRDLVLKGFDEDIRKHLQNEMGKRGIKFITNTTISNVECQTSDIKIVELDNGEKIECDVVLAATGRAPQTPNIGLGLANITCNDRGYIDVSSHLLTSNANVYALGDVIGRVELTPVAIKHGRMVTNNLYGNLNQTVDDASPTAVFSSPPLGVVGLTEAESIEKFGTENIEIYTEEFRPMIHVLSERTERVLMKMIVHKTERTVIGLHMAGKDAAEIIQGFAVAVRAGLTKEQFDATVAIHPSSAEEFVLMKEPIR